MICSPSDSVRRDCTVCGEQRAFEPPVCLDGHGPDCDELACVECGAALFVGTVDFEAPEKSGTLTRVATAA